MYLYFLKEFWKDFVEKDFLYINSEFTNFTDRDIYNLEASGQTLTVFAASAHAFSPLVFF